MFGGPSVALFPPAPVKFLLKQQDFSVLHFRSFCVDGPTGIDDRGYERGLGIHTDSEFVLTIPGDRRRDARFTRWRCAAPAVCQPAGPVFICFIPNRVLRCP